MADSLYKSLLENWPCHYLWFPSMRRLWMGIYWLGLQNWRLLSNQRDTSQRGKSTRSSCRRGKFGIAICGQYRSISVSEYLIMNHRAWRASWQRLNFGAKTTFEEPVTKPKRGSTCRVCSLNTISPPSVTRTSIMPSSGASFGRA